MGKSYLALLLLFSRKSIKADRSKTSSVCLFRRYIHTGVEVPAKLVHPLKEKPTKNWADYESLTTARITTVPSNKEMGNPMPTRTAAKHQEIDCFCITRRNPRNAENYVPIDFKRPNGKTEGCTCVLPSQNHDSMKQWDNEFPRWSLGWREATRLDSNSG